MSHVQDKKLAFRARHRRRLSGREHRGDSHAYSDQSDAGTYQINYPVEAAKLIIWARVVKEYLPRVLSSGIRTEVTGV